jgi:hypothetical protein
METTMRCAFMALPVNAIDIAFLDAARFSARPCDNAISVAAISAGVRLAVLPNLAKAYSICRDKVLR